MNPILLGALLSPCHRGRGGVEAWFFSGALPYNFPVTVSAPPNSSGSSLLLETGCCPGELAKFVCLCQPAGEELIDISAS